MASTRRSLRSAGPEALVDTENAPAPAVHGAKHALQKKIGAKPRAAFTEITNAIEKGITGGKKNITKLGVKKGRVHRVVAPPSLENRTAANVAPPAAAVDAQTRPALTAIKPRAGVKRTATAAAAAGALAPLAATSEAPAPNKKARKLRALPTVSDLTAISSGSLPAALADHSSSTAATTTSGVGGTDSVSCSALIEAGSLTSLSSTASFQTPPESQSPVEPDSEERHAALEARLNSENAERRSDLPDGVIDFDSESRHDLFGAPDYVADVFRYYRERESCVQVERYLGNMQPDLTETMRAILVDWMVEVQESFELNHETLYLAVRLVDLYLGHTEVTRETLQLVGATAIFIACKFDERLPPPLDDFLYICEDAYARKEVIMTEMAILRAVNFDLGLPLSYRFLRRYARCCKLTTETLTLARYILETSLMEYALIAERGSRLAAAALTLAVLMSLGVDDYKKLKPTVEHFSGYQTEEFIDLVRFLNDMLSKAQLMPSPHLKTIRAKYSHSVFHKVATISCLTEVPEL